MIRPYMTALCGLIALAAIVAAEAQTPDSTGPAPIHVPLTMSQTARGTFKADINVSIGNLPPIPFVFDTGSTGLHVFADVNIDQLNSGIQCTQTPTQVTYGNPARMTFTGVMCLATLHIGTATTPEPVPFAYLTKASCPQGVKCQPPNPHDPKQMGGYGIFGAGLAGIISGTGIAPPPILSLSGSYGEVYTIELGRRQGELILGSHIPANAVAFRLPPVTTKPGERWSSARSCLYIDGSPIGTCLITSFDTGNGVPWLHNVVNPLLPKTRGIVQPNTILGFGPEDSDDIGTSVTAGTAFANAIKVEQVIGSKEMTNTGIQAFFGHSVTYNSVYGTVSFAPQNTTGTGPAP